MADNEIILNLWYVHDNNGFIYSLRARCYVGSGADDEKLTLLRRFAQTDYLIAQPFPIPERFHTTIVRETRRIEWPWSISNRWNRLVGLRFYLKKHSPPWSGSCPHRPTSQLASNPLSALPRFSPMTTARSDRALRLEGTFEAHLTLFLQGDGDRRRFLRGIRLLRQFTDRHDRRCGQDVNPVAHPRWRVTLAECVLLLFQRLPHPLRDHGRIVADRERHSALESMRSCDEDAEPTIERVGGYPRFMRTRRVPAAGDHGRLNAFTAGAGNPLDVEDRERHTGIL